MLGERGAQRGLFEADHQYLEAVGTDSFYGFLAKLRGVLFKDEDFARLYKKIGRPSVPPSLLATALLPMVAIAAAALQRAELISYHRGEMAILDRIGLEKAACECYAVGHEYIHRLAD